MSIDHLDPRALPGAPDHPGTPSVRRIRVVRRLGFRRILIDVEVPGRGGPVRVEVLRHGDVLAERTWSPTAPGRHRLRLRLPRRTTAGPALLYVGRALPERVFVPAR